MVALPIVKQFIVQQFNRTCGFAQAIDVIVSGEVLLTSSLINGGYGVGALVPYIALNPKQDITRLHELTLRNCQNPSVMLTETQFECIIFHEFGGELLRVGALPQYTQHKLNFKRIMSHIPPQVIIDDKLSKVNRVVGNSIHSTSASPIG
jgi:hypothetical protein